MKQVFLILVFFCMSSMLYAQSGMLSEEIAITCTSKEERIFTYTNKHFSQYHGLANKYSNNGWHGWICREQKIFTDFSFTVNGKQLPREKAICNVYPAALSRQFPEAISEKLMLLDSVDAVALTITGINNAEFALHNFTGNSAPNLTNGIVEWNISNLLPGFVLSLQIFGGSFSAIKDPHTIQLTTLSGTATLLLQIRSNGTPAISSSILDKLITNRIKRIENVLQKCHIHTGDEKFDKAYLWACASVDALVATQQAKGIFAGLPWFNNNWGRDTFLSLPGACLVNGNYQDAKEILEAFSLYQDTIKNSQFYGRIPNLVTLKNIIYNTADGTPLFVIQAYEYWKQTGDTSFIKKIYPRIKKAYEAAVEKFVDEHGFLTHRDAESWMDAVGPDGPWSPRGNRANDIQIMWKKQCAITAVFARMFDDEVLYTSCIASEKKVSESFSKFFTSGQNIIYDHLNSDGSADKQFRPNIFYVLQNCDTLLGENVYRKIFENSFPKLVTKYGPLSLSYTDKNFHPYHEYPPYYPKDAAYHNGIIWQWNIGPVISQLVKFGYTSQAVKLTKELNRQILSQGAVGTIAELMEALPRKGEKYPRLSGAFSQAWSLAEYIRNIREDYFGIQVDMPNKIVYLKPIEAFLKKDLLFPIFFGNSTVLCEITGKGTNKIVHLKRIRGTDSVTLSITIPKKKALQTAKVNFNTSKQVSISFIDNVEVVTTSEYQLFPVNNFNAHTASKKANMQFANFKLDQNWNIFKKPNYPLLSHKMIKLKPKNAKPILAVQDSLNDEQFDYPTNPSFVSGIADISSISIHENKENYFFELTFRKLFNPQWHPEYGFQLTIAGIYLSQGDNKTGIEAMKNTQYRFEERKKFTKVIFIGGGVEVWNADGAILAAYQPLPEDAKDPLGDTKTGKISFALPKKIVGKIDKNTRLSVLAGTQDDHGGAGLGEFREVNGKAGDWNGGGKSSDKPSNVYDFLFNH